MRIAHFSDIHIQRTPSVSELLGKRLIGLANLYVMGRHKDFVDETVHELVRAVLAQKPDLVLCSGDLTATALESEFQTVHDLLSPILGSIPFALVPGNHDVYTWTADRDRPLEAHFGQYTGGGRYPSLHRFGDISVVGLDPCRFHPLFASGTIEAAQVDALAALLASKELDGSFVILLLHYPLRGRKGEPYGPWVRNLHGAERLEKVIEASGRIGLILHGHVHHGFRSQLPSGVPILDPGSGGIHGPAGLRTAHFNVLEVDAAGLQRVERFAYDGRTFKPETGGAYATGR